MTERPHLSISQIEMHARCPKQWEYRYVYGIKSPPGVAAVIGKSTHAAVELNLRQKMEWGSLMTGEEVQAVAADALKRAWEREEPELRDGDPDQGGAVDMTVKLSTLHHEKLAPAIEPIALEQAFKIFTPQIAHDIMGVIDIETPTTIRDTKTRSKAPRPEVAERSPQLHGYHLRAALDGNPQKSVALDFLIKGKVPRAETIYAQPTAADHVAFLDRVALVSRSVQTGIFPPTNPGEWWCSQKWCGYWHRCPHGARQSTTVGLIDPKTLTSRIIPNPHRDNADEETGEA